MDKSINIMNTCFGDTQEWALRTAGADPTDPSSYIPVGSIPPTCPGSGKICAISAELDVNGQPIITLEIQSQMVIALSSDIDQPCVRLRSAN